MFRRGILPTPDSDHMSEGIECSVGKEVWVLVPSGSSKETNREEGASSVGGGVPE